MIHWNFVGSWVVRSAHFSCKNTRSSIMICKFFNTLIITSLCNKQFFRFGKTEKTLIPYGFSYSWRALQYREKNYVKREGYIPGYSYLWVNLAIEVRWIHLVAIWRKIVMFSPCFNVIYVLKLLQTSKFCDNWRREGGGGGKMFPIEVRDRGQKNVVFSKSITKLKWNIRHCRDQILIEKLLIICK